MPRNWQTPPSRPVPPKPPTDPADLPPPLARAVSKKLLEEVSKGGHWKLRIQTADPPRPPTPAERRIADLLRNAAPSERTTRTAIAQLVAAMLEGQIPPSTARVALYALQVLVSTHRKGGKHK